MRYIRDMRSISTVYLPEQIPRKVSVISYILESQKKNVNNNPAPKNKRSKITPNTSIFNYTYI